MTAAEFRAALKALGLTSSSYARLSGRPRTTVANWTSKAGTPVPASVAEWLKRRLRDLARDPAP